VLKEGFHAVSIEAVIVALIRCAQGFLAR